MVPYNLCSSLLLLKARAIAKRHKETMVPRFRSVPGTILAGVLWTSPFLHQPMSPSGVVRGGGETGVDRTVRSDSSRAGQDLFCAAFHASPSLDVLINSGDCFRVFFFGVRNGSVAGVLFWSLKRALANQDGSHT